MTVNTPSDVIVWGGKSQAIVLRSVLSRLQKTIVAVFDDTPGLQSPFPEVPIFQGERGLDSWLPSRDAKNYGYVIAVGNPHGRARLRIHENLARRGLVPITVIDPGAHIDPTVRIGVGSQVYAGAVVSTDAQIGSQSIVNCGAVVEHETIIGDGVEIAPAAVVLGLCVIETCATIGARATVLARTRIGADAIVGAGVLVATNIDPDARVFDSVQRIF